MINYNNIKYLSNLYMTKTRKNKKNIKNKTIKNKCSRIRISSNFDSGNIIYKGLDEGGNRDSFLMNVFEPLRRPRHRQGVVVAPSCGLIVNFPWANHSSY